jgi:hypothetical protein
MVRSRHELIGLDGTTLRDERWKVTPLRTRSAEGVAALARAKERLASMDFVGITPRFGESLELLDATLGLQLTRYCSCNVNPFARHAAADGDLRAR